MVTIRKAAPCAPIAGDQVLAALAELLALATVEMVSDNGIVMTVRPKRSRGWEARTYTAARLDDALDRALADLQP